MKYFFFILLIINFGCSAQAQLNADFNSNVREGCGSLGGIQFTDLSSGNPTYWKWDFGNGNTSNQQNPIANFNVPNFYTITLIIGKGSNFDTLTRTAFIKIFKNPTANFNFSPPIGCAPLVVNFQSTSLPGDAPISNYNWDFRDGSPSVNQQNTVHTYQTASNYTPNLQVTDQKGCTGSISKGIIQVEPIVVSDFSALGPTTSCANNLTVNFVSNSIGSNLNYSWDFGDGTTSTLKNPSHTYNGFGQYSVSLQIANQNCNDVETKLNYVILANPEANFNVSKNLICKDEAIQFNITTIGAFAYEWNFGDGTTSKLLNPKKFYTDSGTYIVTLKASLANCNDIKKDTIKVEKAIARYAIDSTYHCNPFDTVKFIDQSYNAVNWEWSLHVRHTANGGRIIATSSEQNPFIVYKREVGYFSDTLVVSSPLGCIDTLVKDSSRFYDTTNIQIIDAVPNSLDIWNGCFPRTIDFNSILVPPLNAGNYNYSWRLPSGQAFTGSDPGAITFSDDSLRKIVVNVISENGCIGGDSAYIHLGYPIPPVIELSDSVLCISDTLFITNKSSPFKDLNFFRYELINANNKGILIDTKDSITPVYFFPAPGYYNLSITNVNNGCEAMLVIDSAVFIKGPFVDPKHRSNCNNRKLFNFFGNSSDVTRFKWDFGDSTMDTVNINPIHEYDLWKTYVYKLIAYNDTNGCPPFIDSGQFTITPPPNPTIFPQVESLCLGDTSTIRVLNTLIYDTVEWSVNGVKVTDSSTFHHTFNQRGTTRIAFKSIDFLGCVKTSVKDYYVSKPQAKVGFLTNSNCLPLTVTFKDSSLTDTLLKQSYFVINSKDTIFPNDSYIFTKVGPQAVNFFVTDTLGCSDTLLIPSAFNLKNFEVGLRATSTTEICEGDSINFLNASSDLTAQFIWDFGDGDTMHTSQKIVRHTFDTTGAIKVLLRGENSTGCIKKDSILFLIEKKPTVGFTADTLVSSCYPLEVQFQDTSSGQITDWLWKFGLGNSILKNPRYNFDEIGKFDVFLKVTTANGCSDSLVKTQYIQTNGPNANFSINRKDGCVDDLFQFTVFDTLNISRFIWDFGDGVVDSVNLNPSHYYQKVGKVYPSLILRDSSGKCQISIIDSVIIKEVQADFTVSVDSGCSPLKVSFNNTSIGFNSFQWNFGNGFESSNSSEIKTFTKGGFYPVQLKITSAFGCSDTARKLISVFQTPVVTIIPDTGICPGDSIQLYANGNGTYKWSPSNFLNNDTISNPIAFPTNSTPFNLKVTAENGCVKDTSTFVIVSRKPKYLPLKDTALIIGETLEVNVNVGRHYIYSWTPLTNISCNNCYLPTFKPLQSTTYYLSIKDQFNCFEILDSIYIEVDEKYSLDIPNAFSPNGDGNNDEIFVRGWGIKELIAFRIFNRFGELVFESADLNKGWNGEYKGKKQPIETYIYTVEAITYGGKTLTKKGNISLLR